MESILETKTKYYNAKTIGFATFLGGPLASGILMRANFKNAGNDVAAFRALLLGIFTMILLFGGMFLLPEEVVDQVPKFIVPASYTLVVSLLVNKYQGPFLDEHEEQGGKFYSVWRAAGISLLCIAPIAIAMVLALQSQPSLKDSNLYNDAIAKFAENEEKALNLFSLLEQGNERASIVFIEDQGLPLWKSNLSTLNSLDTLSSLTDDHKEQIKGLKKYCELRIQSYELMHKALKEGSDNYDPQIEQIHTQIQTFLEQE